MGFDDRSLGSGEIPGEPIQVVDDDRPGPCSLDPLGQALEQCGYMRRDKECSDRTVSLEDQRARIAAYCANGTWVLAETLADDGVSAGNRERLSLAGSPVRALASRRLPR